MYISFTVAKKDRSVWKTGKNKDTLSPQSELYYAQFEQITRQRGTLLQESCLCVFDSVWTDNISTGRAFILTLRLQHQRARVTFSLLFFFFVSWMHQCCRSVPASPQELHRLRCRRCGTGVMSWTSRRWCSYGSLNLRSNMTGSAPQAFSFAFDIGVGWSGDSDSWGGCEHWGHLCCF